MQISWSQFKNFIDTRLVSPQYVEAGDNYWLKAFDGRFEVECLIPLDRNVSSDTVDFEDNYKPNSNKSLVSSVKTQFERDDIRLQMACSTAIPDINGDSEISIKIPGELGEVAYIGGGYAFTDIFTFGDRVTNISIVDVDNILGYGAHTVIATYHDDRVPSGNQGWYMWPSPQAGGEIEVEPLGFYGEVPAGLYIELYFKTTAATKVYCDFFWGKQT